MSERLRRSGHDVLACPLQRLEPIDEARLVRRFDALVPVDVLIATSPHAAEVGLRALGVERLRRLRLIAPGAGTADAFRAIGLEVVHPEHGGTSEDVLALPECAAAIVTGRRIVVLAAPGGRTLMARTLTERGADVHRLSPYRRVPVAPARGLVDALSAGRPVVTLLSSAAALRALADALPASAQGRWLGGRFIVSSARLATQLAELGAQRVEVANGASEQALVDALGPPAGS